jgi:hypothetical protein
MGEIGRIQGGNMGKPTFSVFGSAAAWPRAIARLFVGGCVALGAFVGQAVAAPDAAKMLTYKPKQEVSITTPTEAELSRCTVDLDKPRGGVGSSWVLKGPDGRLLRRYYSSSGGAVDLYSYYKDGIEVYREIVSPGAKAPDQFRWINAGGSKYGVDLDKDGTIDTWKVISVEEVSQELMKAMANKDFARFQALTVSDADLKALGLSGEMADAIKAKRKDHKARFEATVAKLTKLTTKANWLHVETPAPDCVLAESTGAKGDILRYPRGTVLFEAGGASDWFQTGAMIKVGDAWKLIEGPAPGAAPTVDERTADGGKTMTVDPAVQKLVEALTDLEKKGGNQHIARADLLEKIIAKVKPTERDPWIRQLADSLSSAAQAEGKATSAGLTRLGSLETQLVKYMPGANLTAYVTFRRLQAEYSISLSTSDSKKFNDVQKGWLTKLDSFVKAYPKSEDAPDAMLQLGMVCEFLGKEVEAKNWYLALVRAHPDKPQALKGEGAARRLGLEGKTMKLAAPLLTDAGTPYDIDQLRGKLVIVYYWASWNGNAVEDFTKLKAVLDKNKDTALLCVNLDQTPDEGKAFLTKHRIPGTHIYRPGGLDSKLAAQYGVMVLPSLFLVGKDGKCVNKGVQIGTVEDEVKKALKK